MTMITRLPVSAIKILESLHDTGPMAPRDISSTTELPLRTVSFGLRRLMGHGFLKKTANLLDMRFPLYSLNKEQLRQMLNSEKANPLMKILPGILDWKKTA